MDGYQLVLRRRRGLYYAFYLEAGATPAYDFNRNWGIGKSVKEALEAAKKHQPKDRPVLYTYLDLRD